MLVCPHCRLLLGDSETTCPRDGHEGKPTRKAEMPASLAPRFGLVQAYAQGASGELYVADDNQTGRRGVLKILALPENTTAAERQRLKRELVKQATLAHPVLSVPLATGEAEGVPWLFREWYEGISLRVKLLRGGALPVPEALAIAAQIAAALDELHRSGLLHRDLKPGHVILTLQPAGLPHVHVIDSGIAAHIESPSLFDVMGTPEYIAPEQAKGKLVSFRSDLYALGCVLFEMLTGSPPFRGTPEKVLEMHGTKAVPTPALALPTGVQTLLAQLLAKEPRERPFSAQQVRRALEPFLPEELNSKREQTQAFESVTDKRRVPTAGVGTLPPPRAFKSTVIGVPQHQPTPFPKPGKKLSADSTEEIGLDGAEELVAPAHKVHRSPFKMASAEKTQPLTALDLEDAEEILTGKGTLGGVGDTVVTPMAHVQPTPVQAPVQVQAAPVHVTPVQVTPAQHVAAPVVHAPKPREQAPAVHALKPTPREQAPVAKAPVAQAPKQTPREQAPPMREYAPFASVPEPSTEVELSKLGLQKEVDGGATVPMTTAPPWSSTRISQVDEVPGLDYGDKKAPTYGDNAPAKPAEPAKPVQAVREPAAPVEPKREPRARTPDPDLTERVAPRRARHIEDDAPSTIPLAVTQWMPVITGVAVAGFCIMSAATAGMVGLWAFDDDEPEVAASPPMPMPPVVHPQIEQPVGELPRGVEPPPRIEPPVREVTTQEPVEEPPAAVEEPRNEEPPARTEGRPPARTEERPAPQESEGPSRVERFTRFRQEALDHFRARRFEQAATAYERATDMNPRHAGSYAGLGASRLALGQHPRAIRAYQRAIQLQPRHAGYHAALGQAFLASGDRGRARQSFQRALTIDPRNGAARAGLQRAGG